MKNMRDIFGIVLCVSIVASCAMPKAVTINKAEVLPPAFQKSLDSNSIATLPKKLFFPGEQIFSTITITNPSICEQITGKNSAQLLIRSLQLYEFPKKQKIQQKLQNHNQQYN